MGWNKVAVVGVGLIKFGELFDKPWEVMVEEAYLNTINSIDKGFDPKDIQAAWLGDDRPGSHGQETISGTGLTGIIGLAGVPCTHVENGCPTGSDAFRNACLGVASGVYDVALVVGAEKMHEFSSARLLGIATQGNPVLQRGETAMTMFAPQATRHMYEFGTTKEQLAMVAVKNHKNGVLDPYSHYKYEITVQDVFNSPMVCYPLNLYDCCPQTDGAAAAIICRADMADKYTDKPIYVAGFGMATDVFYLHEKECFTEFVASTKAAKRAYKMAGIGPQDIDIAELHDCFTITEILDYEDLGFCDKGEGGKLVERGETESDGRIPCNVSGGLITKGHPLGATGIAQIAELFWQLREDKQCDNRQVKIKHGYGLQHNVGGRGISNSMVTILSNRVD